MIKQIDYTIKGYSMYPNYTPGVNLTCNITTQAHLCKINVNDLVVFYHPFKSSVKVLKRVKRIIDQKLLFVEGDNPDPNSSQDSHNFGLIDISDVIAYKKENIYND